MHLRASFAICLLLLVTDPGRSADPPVKVHRIPFLDLKQPLIWSSECEGEKGFWLGFGGQDQASEDGLGHTRIRQADAPWQSIYRELRKAQPELAKKRVGAELIVGRLRKASAAVRREYFQGRHAEMASVAEIREMLNSAVTTGYLEELDKEVRDQSAASAPLRTTRDLLLESSNRVTEARRHLAAGEWSQLLATLRAAQVLAEQALESIDTEPPPRALSPLVYDAKTKLFVLFGGDRGDYLTNDTWTFSPQDRRWTLRAPKTAPPPRAHHRLVATGDGRVTLSGGYTYLSSTDYVGSQYRDIADGTWTYDVAANEWKGNAAGVSPRERTYRAGPFLPETYLAGPTPDAAAISKQLKELPLNTWIAMNPPQKPPLNRDWGSAVIDPDHDLILRWSGGHSAHGGTDVIQYHFATNRWELPIPVEFPLGQLYSNTSYPEGWNLNHRPWITGHTYQSYGYEHRLGQMIFVGQEKHSYYYDPLAGDWVGRGDKPKEMAYDSSYYTLTVCRAGPFGLVCWTQQGKLFQFDAEAKEWTEIPLTGQKLPGSIVDNSTLTYDQERKRLLLFRKEYGEKTKFDGEIHAVDMTTKSVSKLSPAGMTAAAKISYLCQLRYDPDHDLVLCGCTLPPDGTGIRRTPAYDCAKNRWISLKIGGTDPSGKQGRNVSLGLMHDTRRGLFWAVDTHSEVYVLRIDPKTADIQPLE